MSMTPAEFAQKWKGSTAKERSASQEHFIDLRSVTVLDPACGSGNFLYIALQQLKDLEREAIIWGSQTIRTRLGSGGAT